MKQVMAAMNALIAVPLMRRGRFAELAAISPKVLRVPLSMRNGKLKL